MKFDMNIKTKLTVSIGVLVAMIVLLVSLSVTNLQILTATEPDSPAAEPGMNRALTWIMIIGGICICIGLWILFKIPNSINSPFKSLVKGILEIANHNYDAKLDLRGDKELEEVSKNFNRMAKTAERLSQQVRFRTSWLPNVIWKPSSIPSMNPSSVWTMSRSFFLSTMKR